MSAGESTAVLDAGPLIHLDEPGSLNFLPGYRKVPRPELMEREAGKHRPEIPIDSISSLVWVSSNPTAAKSWFELAVQIGFHRGELAANVVMKEHHGDCLLGDDAAARAMAEAIGFQMRDTVGLILRAWRGKQIFKTAACDLSRAMPAKSTLHLRPGFLQNVLQQMTKQTE